MASTVAARKAKARRLQNEIVKAIREKFSLPIEDVSSAPMGVNGMDIKLSARARQLFPFAVEAKNKEALSIWEAMKQAEENAEGLTPILVFRRNRSKIYVCIDFEKFMEII